MSNTELSKFASWFHQDFGLVFDCTKTGVEAYLDQLSAKRLDNLSNELSQLLEEYPGKGTTGLKNAWFRLGAQWWNNKEMPLILSTLSKSSRNT